MKHIKLFEKYVESEYNDKEIGFFTWLGLDNEIRVDIVENIYDNSIFLKKNYNIWTFKKLLDDSYELPQFEIVEKNVNSLWEDVKDKCNISNTNLIKLLSHLDMGETLNPILLYNNKFYDGCHRLAAYKEMEIETIPTIDIGKMLDMDWEKWLNSEIDF
jgi:hypothetical protein